MMLMMNQGKQEPLWLFRDELLSYEVNKSVSVKVKVNVRVKMRLRDE